MSLRCLFGHKFVAREYESTREWDRFEVKQSAFCMWCGASNPEHLQALRDQIARLAEESAQWRGKFAAAEKYLGILECDDKSNMGKLENIARVLGVSVEDIPVAIDALLADKRT